MREGRVRTDVPYVWPASLLRPVDAQLVHLDLNHWIGLPKAATGHPTQAKWTRNDMFDIDALSVATPYCDIVVTERHAHHVLHQAGLPERLGTEVLATPEELVTALAVERD